MEPGHIQLFPTAFRYEVHRTVTAADIHLWAGLTGTRLPARSGSAFAQQAAAASRAAPEAYLTGLVADTAARLVACIPPPGAILTALAVQFMAHVLVGTTLMIVVTVAEWDAAAGLYWLDISATRADNRQVLTGRAGLRPQVALLATA